ncbi:MAG: hypothetical protein H6581_22895 [Bacteroidia bacterium]|nr:hypothetical protein [Bacteroidia bacterium]
MIVLLTGFACLFNPSQAQLPSRFFLVKTSVLQYVVPEFNISLEKSIGKGNSIELRTTLIMRGIWADHESRRPYRGIYAGLTSDGGAAIEAGYRRYFNQEIFAQATFRYRTWINENFVHSLPAPSGIRGERVYQLENIYTTIKGFKLTTGVISGLDYPGGIMEVSFGLGLKFIHQETYAQTRSQSATLWPPDPTFGSYTEIRSAVRPSIHFTINLGLNFKPRKKEKAE